MIGAIALVATVPPIAAFLAGVHRIGPSRATILGTVEPPVTIGLSALVFGERLGPLQLLGAGLVVAAVVILHCGAARAPAGASAGPGGRPAPLPDTERIAA